MAFDVGYQTARNATKNIAGNGQNRKQNGKTKAAVDTKNNDNYEMTQRRDGDRTAGMARRDVVRGLGAWLFAMRMQGQARKIKSGSGTVAVQ